ncbi:MAG TPA: pilus assembly PilX N-terminal domain-containing protein [Nitrospira sp.]|nr:pilus assembly PilX N-terminal domain-containing protein [Nitrospira sp.]
MALLTVIMVLLMLTVLGIAAITASSLENNMAGMQRTMESAGQAAESCLGTGANVILQTLLPENGAAIPAVLVAPAGPVVATNNNPTILGNEIMGNPENNIDVAVGVGPTGLAAAPNIQMTVGPYNVVGDIDRLYIKLRAGSGQQQFAAYDGTGVGAGSNGSDVYFRITCIATNTATGTENRVSSLYACALTGDGCQKQP